MQTGVQQKDKARKAVRKEKARKARKLPTTLGSTQKKTGSSDATIAANQATGGANVGKG